jgi:lysozyme family protein
MADFKLYWPLLVQNEGYYANVAGDSGGETYMGVSRVNYPNWQGWEIVDSYKGNPNFPHILRSDNTLTADVQVFYITTFWDVLQGDKINNQSIANFIADWGINAGLTIPVKHTQEILNVNNDGKVGPVTLAAINNADGQSLFTSLQTARIAFYNAVVAAHPSDSQFLADWVSRTNSFSYQA